jgi:hypothetical protein
MMDEVHREAMADYRASDTKARQLGTNWMARKVIVERTRRDYIDSGKADQEARVDRGEYEGEWLERQDARDDR